MGARDMDNLHMSQEIN